MRRRSVLATLALGPVAGCGTRLPPFARTPSSVGSTTTPPLDDLPCPPDGIDPAAAVCAHRADDPPVVVRATERVAPVDAPEIGFVLANTTGEALRFNPHTPDVYRYVGGPGDEYDLVERQSSGSGVVEVPPGGEHEWRLADLPQVDRLSPGTYLFGVSVPTGGRMDTDWVTCLAPFRLTADGD
jgi:hypothetical protein